MQITPANRFSVYGAFGFVLGEFCREYPEETIRIPKNEIIPETSKIIYGISTTDNYNVFDKPTLDIETNLLHLMDVLSACHQKYGNKFEFNFISSWFVYGRNTIKEYPLGEDLQNCAPKGFYSITKYAAELMLVSYCDTFKIKYKILRLANVLGHRDTKVSAKKNALQYLIDRLVHNEDIELYNGGNFYRDYIDVRDCVVGIRMAIENDQYPVYNISNGLSHKFKDLIDYVVEYSKTRGNVWDKLEVPDFHSVVQSKDTFLSNSRLKEIGYVPKYDIQTTLRSIIDDYK